MFIVRLDSLGEYLWGYGIGGTGTETCDGLAISGLNIICTGGFADTVDFDPGNGTAELTSNGDQDCYLLSLTDMGGYNWASSWGGTSWDDSSSVASNPDGDIWTCGSFMDTVDFDPGDGTDERTPVGFNDSYIVHYPPDGNW